MCDLFECKCSRVNVCVVNCIYRCLETSKTKKVLQNEKKEYKRFENACTNTDTDLSMKMMSCISVHPNNVIDWK